ncbi:type IV toxin-antitoxin system AbiEi family antitoxin domain-containing protein [Arthrobacter sp. SDTb3-6]|uniref:type IV toxin-antitoxin system AbiEi family antitoxin domain-containing protein n=1 Tax=Arthrobacter sp. SDTb3-6 TaxID=2713571 RepID=UPI00159D9C03|nr:type IV toxin-antitoxin system AbiEi family antitoxin domain-containing protein [Arthrobacter sp. SDTb3-6]NVM99271.1 type IV toxin-antitoxin system AbiEi family antitoxin domain-containing protein [Arthrobacter sp. SDTb3-6]
MENSKALNSRSVEEEVAWYGKVARRKDLLVRGCTPWAMKKAEDAGQIQRIGRGYYALPDADPLDVRLARHQARRTCFTKAEQLGLWIIKSPPVPHVAAAHGRPVPGCVVHKVSGQQTLMDILRQCVKCGSEVDALVVLESAVVLKECTIPQLRAAFAGREDTRGRAVIDMIDPQSMSIVETVARYYVRKAGLNVQGQFYVPGVGHLDLLVEGILGVETDGAEYHNTAKGWAEDLRRDNLLVVKGMWCLRIPAAVVLGRPDIMLGWVQQALAMINGSQK